MRPCGDAIKTDFHLLPTTITAEMRGRWEETVGGMEEAHDALRAGLELNPSFTIARFKSQTFSDNPVYLAGRERMYEGLRKAGLPER